MRACAVVSDPRLLTPRLFFREKDAPPLSSVFLLLFLSLLPHTTSGRNSLIKRGSLEGWDVLSNHAALPYEKKNDTGSNWIQS